MNRSFVLQRSSASGAAVASWILPGVRVRVSLGAELRDRCERAGRRGESCSQCSQHLSCSPPPPPPPLAPSKSLLPPPRRAELAEACGGVPAEACPWLCGWEPPLLGKGNGARLPLAPSQKTRLGRQPQSPSWRCFLVCKKVGIGVSLCSARRTLLWRSFFPGDGFSC